MQTCAHPALEKDLLSFVQLARSQRVPVTEGIIILKALALRAKHNVDEGTFEASRGWLHNFLRRSGMSGSMHLHGEAGEVKKAARRTAFVLCETTEVHTKPYIQ